MATLYNKTALKKIKKDELIQMFLDLQARHYNSRMDSQERFEQTIEELKEQLDEQYSFSYFKQVKELTAENKKLKGIIEEQKGIIDELAEDLDEDDDIKTQLEELKEHNKQLITETCHYRNNILHNPAIVQAVKTDYESRYKNKISNLERDIEYITNQGSARLIFKYKQKLEEHNLYYYLSSDSDDDSD